MLEKIIKQLEKQEEALRTLVQKREDYVDDRTEAWQESEKCEEYMDRTQELEAQADDLDVLIDELKELKD